MVLKPSEFKKALNDLMCAVSREQGTVTTDNPDNPEKAIKETAQELKTTYKLVDDITDTFIDFIDSFKDNTTTEKTEQYAQAIADTYTEIEKQAESKSISDLEEKHKKDLEELDTLWRNKYRERFLSSRVEDKPIQDEEKEKPLTIEDCFVTI